MEAAAAGMSLERFGTGEVVQCEGSIPDGMRFLRHGRLSLRVTVPGAGSVQLDEILPGDYIGMITLTKENITPGAIALEEVEVLFAPQAVIEDLVRETPLLARDLGRQLDLRRARQRELIAARAEPSSNGGLVVATGDGGSTGKCLGHHLRVGSGRTGRLVDDAPDQWNRSREGVRFPIPFVSVTLQALLDRVKNRPVAPNCNPFYRTTARRQTSDTATSSDRADDEGVALPATAAQGGGAGAPATPAQLVEQRQGEAVAAHADRVAEGDGPAVDVDDVAGDARGRPSRPGRRRRTPR